jgi:hypothetical protein
VPRTGWLAPPPAGVHATRAPGALGDRICAAARGQVGDVRCEAWQFPELATSQGAVYFASTDSGRADVLVRARPDGKLVAGAVEDITDDMWLPLYRDVELGKLSAQHLLQLRLLVAGEQVEIRDVKLLKLMPGHGRKLLLEATIEDKLGRMHAELPGRVHAPERFHVELGEDGSVSMHSI